MLIIAYQNHQEQMQSQRSWWWGEREVPEVCWTEWGSVHSDASASGIYVPAGTVYDNNDDGNDGEWCHEDNCIVPPPIILPTSMHTDINNAPRKGDEGKCKESNGESNNMKTQ